MDARHQDPEVINQVLEIIKAIPKVVEKCETSYEKAWARNTVHFYTEFVDYVEKNAKEFGYSTKECIAALDMMHNLLQRSFQLQ
ncbi:hypothetical protein DFN01_000012 [Clostridium beijerinckii]|nr:hypothetical protein [Clostridium beijerinckii]